jgi:predicted MFS family arabinose efflux permease
MIQPTDLRAVDGSNGLSKGNAFVVAAFALVSVFAAAGTPIPLYNLYSAEDGITHSDLGMVSVGYFVAAATSLLILGRVSDFVGRRSMAIAALTSAALSCGLLVIMHSSSTMLLVARVLQGLACGIASSAIGAYVVDSAPPRPRWLAAAITGSSPMVGIPIGAVLSGALAVYGPAPRTLVYVIVGVLLLLLAGLMAISPEMNQRRPGALGSLRPQLSIPAGSLRLVVVAGATSVATWSLGGFYQAFGPSVVAENLGTPSPLLAAVVFACVMILNPMGGPLAGRLSPMTAVRVGMLIFMAAVVGIIAALHAGAVVPFIVASLVVGLAQGAASTGAIRSLLVRTSASARAGVLSTIYLVSYCGAAIPVMVAAHFAATMPLFKIAVGYAVLGVTAASIAIVASRAVPSERTQEG